jgi:hypothetical protein
VSGQVAWVGLTWLVAQAAQAALAAQVAGGWGRKGCSCCCRGMHAREAACSVGQCVPVRAWPE